MLVMLFLAAAAARRRGRRRASNDWDFGYERDILSGEYEAVPAARERAPKRDQWYLRGRQRGRILRLINEVIEREARP